MNWTRIRNIVLALTVVLPNASLGAGTLTWADLIDESAQEYEDPYRDLTPDQLEVFGSYVRNKQKLTASGLTSETHARLTEDMDRERAVLAETGIDADWLISQRWVVAERRERAATAGNPDVSGQTVTLSGFAIAAPKDEAAHSVIYLVPERGLCSHMPPPNPNQMLKVHIPDGWRPSYIHEPVQVTGRITIDPSQSVFHIVDGPVSMNATFKMSASTVATAGDLAESRAGTEDWVSSLRKSFADQNTERN